MKIFKKSMCMLLAAMMAFSLPITAQAAATTLTHETLTSRNGNFSTVDYNGDDYIFTEFEGVENVNGIGYIYIDDTQESLTLTMNSGKYTSSTYSPEMIDQASWHYGDSSSYTISTDYPFTLIDGDGNAATVSGYGYCNGAEKYEDSGSTPGSNAYPTSADSSVVTSFELDTSNYTGGKDYYLTLSYKYQMKKYSWWSWSTVNETLEPQTISFKVVVSHKESTPVKQNEVAATCTTDGSYDEITTCEGCGIELSNVHKTIEKSNHNPADAVKENIVAATCTADGSYDEVVYCKDCGTELSRNSVVEPAIGHNFTGDAISNENSTHSYKCSNSGCTEIGGIEACTFVQDPTTAVAPTCTKAGKEADQVCSVCGYAVTGVAISATGHNYTGDAVSNNNGTHSFKCVNDGCNAVGNAVPCTLVVDESTAVDATHSTEGKTADMICSVCGYVATGATITSAQHDFRGDAVSNGNGTHSYKCVDDCDATGNTAACPLVKNPATAIAATCTTDGKEADWKCEICGYSIVGATIPATGHSFTGAVVSNNDGTHSKLCANEGCTAKDVSTDCTLVEDSSTAVAPTCTKAGKEADKVCSVCGYTVTGATIAATGHSWNAGVVTKKATCGATGVKTYTCTVCGATKTSTIAKTTSHSFGTNNATCSVCGTANPNYTTSTGVTTKDVEKIYGVDSTTAAEITKVAETNKVSESTLKITDSTVTSRKSDSDLTGSTYNLLKAKSTTATKNSIKITWSKVKNADGYIIYANKCGKNNKLKKVKTVSSKVTSYTYSKLKKGTYYKFVVVAYKKVNKTKVTLAASKSIHAITSGGKYGVAKSVSITKVGTKKKNTNTVTIKKGKTAKITAKEVKKDKTIKKHREICYETSNKSIATVDSKGKITAKKKGTCYIYVYAQNGVYKSIKVTVK